MKLATHELIHETEVARARARAVVELAEISLEHSDIVISGIEEDINKSQPELDEALSTLRVAGLLKYT